jgi:hypothetical protein
MANRFMKVWSDPVWSKVIAAAIIAIAGVAGGVISHYWGPASKYLSIPIPLWIGFIVFATALAIGAWHRSRPSNEIYNFSPEIKRMGVDAPDPNPNIKLDHPVKCWWTFRNDSVGCIDVSLSDFRAKNIKIKTIPSAILQVQMRHEWLPRDHGMPQVAVLPGQLFKGWISADESLYSAAQVRGQFNNLGTLVLKINGELREFEL